MALEPLPTEVARAIWGDNLFRGRLVSRDIAGREGFWSMVSLGLGYRALGADEAGVLDDCAASLLVADPRIWPLKLCRLVASYGRPIAAMGAAQVWLDAGMLGPAPFATAAVFLQELMAEIGHEPKPELLAGALQARQAKRERLHGFGLPYRPSDERVPVLETCLRRRGLDGRPFFALVTAAGDALVTQGGKPANIAGAVAAACLDLGFAPRQIALLAQVCLSLCFLANAVEAAEQMPEVLRRLPEGSVRYTGPALRPSPRAVAAGT